MERPFTVEELDHVVVRCRDQSRSLAFYTGVLGLPEERRLDVIGLIQLRAGRSLIDLVPADPPPTHEGRKLAIRYNTTDTIVALGAAFFVNAAILIVSSAVFFSNGVVVTEIKQAHELLEPVVALPASEVVERHGTKIPSARPRTNPSVLDTAPSPGRLSIGLSINPATTGGHIHGHGGEIAARLSGGVRVGSISRLGSCELSRDRRGAGIRPHDRGFRRAADVRVFHA